jgi:hypothetical protein
MPISAWRIEGSVMVASSFETLGFASLLRMRRICTRRHPEERPQAASRRMKGAGTGNMRNTP